MSRAASRLLTTIYLLALLPPSAIATDRDQKNASTPLPQPPRRPFQAQPPSTQPAPMPQPALPAAKSEAPSCGNRLRSAGIVFEESAPPDAPIPGCGAPEAVLLISVATPKGQIELSSKPLVDCAYALTFGEFLRDLAAPLSEGVMKARLVAVDTGPGYECRGRNGDGSAKISAHGKGLAIDVSSFSFSDKRRVLVERQAGEEGAAFVKTLRRAACGWFSTVLGPGSDDHHASHIHLDIEPHGSNGYRICQ